MAWRAGDIGAASGIAFTDRLIQFGQLLRRDRFWQWNHIFIVVDDNGGTIEAGGNGVARGHVADHPTSLNLGNPVDRLLTIGFVTRKLGVPYGYLDVVLLGIDCLFGSRLHWRLGKAVICSELASQALIAAGWKSPQAPSLMKPADVVAALAGDASTT